MCVFQLYNLSFGSYKHPEFKRPERAAST